MTLPILWTNNANSALASGINSGATSVTVTTSTGAIFPQPGAGQYFVATFIKNGNPLIYEIIHVTAVSGDTFTIVRGQEGTSALSWATGDLIANNITAGALANINQGAETISAVSGSGSVTLTAAQMLGGVINRTGPTAAYGDTTDTAANIVAAIPFAAVGLTFNLRILNTVNYVDVVAAGSGVTLAGTTAIAASTWRDYIGTITNVASPAVTLTGVGAGALASTAPPLSNYISGLTLSTAGGSGTFGISAGVAADSTNAALMALPSAFTKTTGAWVVGTGNGSLDTGSIANNTWYTIYEIQRTDTRLVDIICSTN